ncbi:MULTISPECIES: hypothetical protein [unclassified Nocardioides]|uniref:hypothetical protein n=1 Tax=unclassified Nocardioides TaxID=2615069 RepID=UPI0007036778|nr:MULTISPECIES: hypothetical protein [unclassified Nocardioides]KRC53938.1 hypothetical protein ASE19_07610 [Nocardioides sp. Root79]KRC71274.1 hypothetical protein ASE20_10025 [Nocardioides sp. Root240]
MTGLEHQTETLPRAAFMVVLSGSCPVHEDAVAETPCWTILGDGRPRVAVCGDRVRRHLERAK